MQKTKNEILENVNKPVLKSKFIARNTLEVQYKDGSKAIRYHNTDVVTILPDGSNIFNTGGWYTRTTKERINQYNTINAIITQKDDVWYINRTLPFIENEKINKKAIL